MKRFELAYLCAEPFLPPLGKLVRRRLLSVSKTCGKNPRILDVGGRKSHYTIRVPADITVTDLPRETDIQKQLTLGINDQIVAQTLARRTNIREVLFDDMTCSSLPNATFDCVVAVEVLEHVERDADFVSEVSRVLKPNGMFLMTTPNGDFVRNTNPDHKRHYTRRQLTDLLSSTFDSVKVEYAIRSGIFRRWGLKSWSLSQPANLALSIIGNLVNTLQSSDENIKNQSIGTNHLVATAHKSAQPVSSLSVRQGSPEEPLLKAG